MPSSNDDTQQKQLDMQNQLAQQQLATENSTLSGIKTSLAPYLNGSTGYTPAQLASLNTSVLDQNAQKYNAATQQTNASVAAHGENGMTPISGVAAGQYGSLNTGRASDLSSGLNTVVQNNAQQALANQFNANSILSGNAQTEAGTVGTFNSGASSALNAVTQAQQNSFLNNFTKTLGAGLGAATGAATTGGLGTAASTIGSGNYGW